MRVAESVRDNPRGRARRATAGAEWGTRGPRGASATGLGAVAPSEKGTRRPYTRSLHRTVALSVCLTLYSVSGARAGQSAPASDPSGALDPRGVVVLPFSNISGDTSDEWIGAGIAETVSADLSRLGMASTVVDLEATPSEPAGDRLGLTDDARARHAAQELGVAWIITGGFQRVGGQLRVIARSLDVESGAVRHTATLDGMSDDLFALQDRIVAALAESLDLPLVGAGPRSASPGRRFVAVECRAMRATSLTSVTSVTSVRQHPQAPRLRQ